MAKPAWATVSPGTSGSGSPTGYTTSWTATERAGRSGRSGTALYKSGSISVNGTKILTPNYTSMPQQTLYLFSNHTSYPLVGRIYNFSITNSSNVKTLNLIPVRVGQVGYMYDTINNQLYGNIGTGDFTVGPDITS